MTQFPTEDQAPPIAGLAGKRPIRVLHVNDEQGFLKVAKLCLETEGPFEVETATSVDCAKEKMRVTDYDVIVSDYQMPGKDGLEFLKELRAKNCDIPFIIFTGKGREEITIKAISLGANRYLNKTGSPETVYGELARGIRQVVQQKQAEEARAHAKVDRQIRENQVKFEGLFRGNPEATVYLSPDFHMLDCNPRFKELFGYIVEEIRGKHINDVIVPKDEVGEARKLDKKAVKGYVYHDSLRKRKDGSLVPVSISAAPIEFEGKLIGIVALYKDISDLKKTERQLALMNEKLRVVGGLTRHDARNKLTTITGNAYLARKKLAGNTEVASHLDDIEKAVEQVVRIFEHAKTYEMLGSQDLTQIDVEKTINEAISLFPDLHGVEIINECHRLTVRADSLLRQLFYNLIDNSFKYGQKLDHIKIHCVHNEAELTIVYEDDGMGIPQAVKPLIFDEGFTTGKGSGYGLYLIRKMMEVYGWRIKETGEAGKGARFTIIIPKIGQDGKENYELT